MTLSNFLNTYGDVDRANDFFGGNHCISIEDYCEECSQEEVMTAPWWKDIRNRTVKRWQTIGGGSYKVEICITLKELEERF